MDDEDMEPRCDVCGNPLDWEDCYEIDCEDGQVDLYEEDAINFNPGETEPCTTCLGEGGWWFCRTPHEVGYSA
jgi:hypothetical protein